MDRQELKRRGFIIDSHCYPNIAYKGPRFAPTEWREVPTELEEQQAKQIKALRK